MSLGDGISAHGLPLHAHLDKVPPGWHPGAEAKYPYRKFRKDFLVWVQTTSLEKHRIGPALVLRMADTPKEIGQALMEEPSNRVAGGNQLQHGYIHTDPLTGATTEEEGYMIYIRALDARYGRLTQERLLLI